MLIPPLRIRLFTTATHVAIIAVILGGSSTDASAQGPIRRLGDRLRQRAADQTPASQRSPRAAAESPANPAAPRQPGDVASGSERRSSNFNRAIPLPPPASIGQRDSGWESRAAGTGPVAGVSAESPLGPSDLEKRGPSRPFR
jgi:hypothetical protein